MEDTIWRFNNNHRRPGDGDQPTFNRLAGSILFLVFSTLLFRATDVSAERLIFNTQEFAPFNYSINGKVKGPVADIIRRVCDEISANCTMKSLPWRRAQNNVMDGKANAMFVIGWNKERSLWLDFSPPILNTEYGFFVNASNTRSFNTIADFDGMRIGVFGPSNTSTSLSNLSLTSLKKIVIDMTPDDISAFKKLAVNRLDATYSNREVGAAIIAEYRIDGLRYALSHRALKYYIGFSKQYAPKALVRRFNNSFRELYAQGVIQSILAQYDMSASELD